MKIVIAGEGGQGIQTIAETLAYASHLSGLQASILPQFGVEQRGTPSVAFIVVDNEQINSPRFFVADLVVILRSRAIESVQSYVNPHTTVVFDSSTINRHDLPKSARKYLGIPATRIAKKNYILKVFNVIVLGAILKLVLKEDQQIFWEALTKFLGKKFVQDPKIKTLNKDALNEGLNFIFETSNYSLPIFSAATRTIIQKGSGKTAKIEPNMCKGCGICIEKCPVQALSFSEDIGFFGNVVPKVDLEKCILCQNCYTFCPDTAISVKKDSK